MVMYEVWYIEWDVAWFMTYKEGTCHIKEIK